MGMICWSPLASGMLSGKYRGQESPAKETRFGKSQFYARRFWWKESVALVDEVATIAEELGKTSSQIALAWLLGDRRVAAPIVGARTVDQIGENLLAGEFDLPAEFRDRLSESLPLSHGYPKEWMDGTMPGMLKHAEYAPHHASSLP